MAIQGPVRTPVRGRDGELSLVGEQLRALHRGHGTVVLVEGGAGLGTSRLLDEIGAMGRRLGVRAHRGAGDPLFRVVPLGPLIDALLWGDDALLEPDALRDLSLPEGQRQPLLQDLQEHLEQAARGTPLVIVLDDLQWSDPLTSLALRTLPARLSTHAIGWVLAARVPHTEPELGETWAGLQQAGATTVRLSPLDRPAVTQVAHDVLGAEPDDELRRVLDGVGGRPFLLLELLRGLLDERAVTIAGGVAQLVGRRIPARLRESVRARLDALSAPARDLVLSASLLGHSAGVEDLAAVLRRSPASLAEAVADALSADLLVEQDGLLRFRHDLIREVVETDMPSAMRRARRRDAVDVLVARGTPAVVVAELLVDTAKPGDHAAIGLLRQAAAELAPTASASAARLSERALALVPRSQRPDAALVVETVGLLWRCGRMRRASELAETALGGLLEPEHEAGVRLELARLSRMSSFPQAADHARRGASLPGLPAALEAELLGHLCVNLLCLGEVAEAERRLPDALALARGARADAAEALLVTAAAMLAQARGDARDALALADVAVSVAERSGPIAATVGVAAFFRALLWASLDRLDEAAPAVDRAIGVARRQGYVVALRVWVLARAQLLLATGRLEDARAEAEAALGMVEDVGRTDWPEAAAIAILSRVAILSGDRQDERVRAGIERMCRDDVLVLRRAGAWLAAIWADAEGDPTRAMARAGDLYTSLYRVEPTCPSPSEAAELPSLVRMALRAGDRDRAAAVVAAAERRAAAAPGLALAAAAARHARGLLDGDAAALEEAAGLLARSPRVLTRAFALEDLGAVLAERGLTDAARGRLEEALALYASARAAREAARVRLRLRELGVRVADEVDGADEAESWGGLTASERKVVRLVAEGATNREVAERLFLSPHTVSSHLRHAFAKLGIGSRAELARLWLERDAAPEAPIVA